jgi:zinc/manganese transport system permease protein
MLVMAGLAKILLFVPAAQRRHNGRIAASGVAVLALAAVLGSSLWLIFNPAADQPLLAAIERTTGLGPANFLDATERATYQEATRDAIRFQQEVAALNAKERAARVGAPLSDEEVRRVASYQQSFNEMARGELFVEDVLRTKARRRERWIVGLPAATLALAGLGIIFWHLRHHGLS